MFNKRWELLTAGISVLLSLAALEVYLRIDDYRPEPVFAPLILAGEEFALFDDPAKLGQVRDAIVFVGDSFTEGAACGREGNFPAVFGDLARPVAPELITINFARENTNTWSHLRKAQALLQQEEKPRGAIVTLFVNDIEYECTLCYYLDELRASNRFTSHELELLETFCTECRGQFSDTVAHHSPARRLHRWVYERSYVYRLARDAMYPLASLLGVRVGWRMDFPDQWRIRDGLNYKLLDTSVRSLAEQFRDAQVPLLITLYPPTRDISRDNPFFETYRGAAADLEASAQVPVLSGYDAFLDEVEPGANLSFSLTDGHPSCAAHAAYAAWLFEQWHRRFPLARTEAVPDRAGFAERDG